MSRRTDDPSRPLPANFVVYDPLNPSPLFSHGEVHYIDLPNHFLSKSDSEIVRKLEWFILNTNTGIVSYDEIPGLRGGTSITGGRRGYLYVRRFSNDLYGKMMDSFLSFLLPEFPKEGSGCNMPGYRVTLPNGDRFYPFLFFGDLAAWQKRLRQSADLHRTELGQFEQGAFVVTDGRSFDFGQLVIDRLDTRATPKSW